MTTYKKLLSIIIIPVIMFCVIFDCFHQLNINVSSAVITTAYIDGSNVRVRTSPSLSATIIEEASYRTATVIGQTTAENYVWYHITYHNGNEQITGYIAYDSSYIRIVEYNPDANFETKLLAFPESYRNSLRELHAVYPNWEFIPDPVNVSFWQQVDLQSVNMRKQVSLSSQPISWRSMGLGYYNWSTNKWESSNGGWTGASKEIIAYYMDPRNFLNDTYIYMFLQQSFDSTLQTEEGVSKILKGTFMENNYNDPNDTVYGGSYAKVLMAAANANGVNPYILASKIKQEIGTTESNMVSGNYPGYEGLYNFYNIGASGDNGTVLVKGLQYAREKGWTTRSAAIIQGAAFLADSYIKTGQDTYYLQDFNIHDTNNIWHQYAQAVHDAASKGYLIASNYKNQPDYHLSFKIPVFNTMPEFPCSKPVSNDLRNNYYLKNIQVSGLTPSFSMYNQNYSLYVSGNTNINAIPVDGAKITGTTSFNLKKGYNLIYVTVQAENGHLNCYNIEVDAAIDCILNISSSNYLLGDTNFDGVIDIVDLAKVQMHILNLKYLTADGIKAADTNNDGNIDIVDLAKVQMHILGLKFIN